MCVATYVSHTPCGRRLASAGGWRSSRVDRRAHWIYTHTQKNSVKTFKSNGISAGMRLNPCTVDGGPRWRRRGLGGTRVADFSTLLYMHTCTYMCVCRMHICSESLSTAPTAVRTASKPTNPRSTPTPRPHHTRFVRATECNRRLRRSHGIYVSVSVGVREFVCVCSCARHVRTAEGNMRGHVRAICEI